MDNNHRQAAIERLENKREFKSHILVYAVVNLMLIVIWAATGANYFWPIWSIAGWGIGLALHAWNIYGQRSISEEDIRKESERDRV